QWSATLLYTPGDWYSDAVAGAGALQGGRRRALNGFNLRPGYWAGSAASWTDLANPGQPEQSGEVLAMSGNRQAGKVGQIPCVWNGSWETRIDLTVPAGMNQGFVRPFGMAGEQIVGQGRVGNIPDTAILWPTPASAPIIMNPPGISRALLYDTDGTRQVGAIYPPGGSRTQAAMWFGTPSSYVNLNPFPNYSTALAAIGGDQQVGAAGDIGTGQTVAGLWRGTAESFVNLNPFGAQGGSIAWDTNGWMQVGAVSAPGAFFGRAAAWFGTPESWVDLQAFLPPDTSYSVARAIGEANGVYYIAGFMDRQGITQAVVWTFVPAPGSGAALAFLALFASRRRRR
ncbi:MAG: hypothetical protein ACKVW3_08765, partial [Phycisphaerales bacterium]